MEEAWEAESTFNSEYDGETPRHISDDEKSEGGDENIRVVCRFRPENDQERQEGQKFVSIKDDHTVVTHKGSVYDEEQAEFQYNRIFPDYSSTADVFRYISDPLIDDVLNGFNGCIMAYGQTGSGKTYSMLGPGFDDAKSDKVNAILGGHSRGIIPRVMEAIFDRAFQELGEYTTRLGACYVEIYKELLFDLLAPVDKAPGNSPNRKVNNVNPNDRLVIQESAERGLWIRNARNVDIQEPNDVMRLMAHGNQNRVIAATKQNKESSRSHAIFIVTIHRYHIGKMTTKISQLHLADLAGSERVDVGQQAEVLAEAREAQARVSEAKKINTSLFALGRVIHALSTGGKHISFRDSKLTRILQNSLGGNSKTTLLIHCSPSSFNKEETLSTLRFGEKTKNIKNKPTSNEQLDAEALLGLLNKSKEEVAKQRSYISKLENELLRTQMQLTNPNYASYNFGAPLDFSSSSSSSSTTSTSTTTTTTTTTTTPADVNNNNDANDNYNNNNNNNNNANNTNFSNTSPVTTDTSSEPESNTPPKLSYPTTPTNSDPTNKDSIHSTLPRPNTAVVPGLQPLARSTSNSLVSPRTPTTPQTPTTNTPKPATKKPLQTFSAFETLHFMCPLSGKLFQDPVTAADGYTYEREAIVKYLKHSKKSPITRAELDSQTLIPNFTLLRQLQNIKPRLVHTQVPYMDLLSYWALHEILAYLPVVDLLYISETSRQLNKVASSNLLWTALLAKKKYLRQPGLTPKENFIAGYKKTKYGPRKSPSKVKFDVHLVVSKT